jgi:rhodanese-related sulfurtransferase
MEALRGTEALALARGPARRRLAGLDPAQPVGRIRRHGTRSAQVVAFLPKMGSDSSYNLGGGIDAGSREIDPGVPRH